MFLINFCRVCAMNKLNNKPLCGCATHPTLAGYPSQFERVFDDYYDLRRTANKQSGATSIRCAYFGELSESLSVTGTRAFYLIITTTCQCSTSPEKPQYLCDAIASLSTVILNGLVPSRDSPWS